MAKHVTRVSSVPVSTLDAAAAVFGYRLRCMVSRLLSVLLGLLCASSVAIAQSGSVHGSIVDPQNVPVAQAHIRLVNSGGTTVAETTSNAQGNFTLSDIAPGVYQLKAEAPSFVTVVADVSVAAGQRREASLQFQNW
jgi:hypothetical protein